MAKRRILQTHCKRRHELTPDNLINRSNAAKRTCKLCHALKERERYETANGPTRKQRLQFTLSVLEEIGNAVVRL